MSKITCLLLCVVAASLTIHVEQKPLMGFSMKFSVAARSYDLCPVNGNRLALYYMGPKHTGELWVYIGTPLPNPSGNTGVTVDAEGESLRDSLRPIIVACSQEHGVSDADIQAAKDAGSPASIKPCFIGCVFKKAGFLNDKGEVDAKTGLKNLRQFVKDDEQYNKLEDVVKQCSSVKDKPVSDGTAGCERGVLMAGCLLEHKTSIII